jgi:RNA recognition motif-containing protein
LITLTIRGLPPSITDESLNEMFSEFGSVLSLKVIKDSLSGDCKGIAFIGMDNVEAQAAVAGLDGKKFKGRPIRVELKWPSHKSDSSNQ